MSIAVGDHAGMIAPDDVTFNHLRNRSLSLKGDEWDHAVTYWKSQN